ncbi:hypothetical protein [Kutzneria chonburiensis]|uniref:Uncharacterized protein n=1 Tax=Kutzneria chonburiensis TaxID=1483604 RepID=A0ABV6N2X4_9PSEU|nr:hypothetical protein [Kutzneria chonburiensis]
MAGLINLTGVLSAAVDQYSNAGRDAVSLVIGVGLAAPVVYVAGLGIVAVIKKLRAVSPRVDELLDESAEQPGQQPAPERPGARHAR